MKNRYIRHSHLREVTFKHLLRCYTEDLTAATTARLTAINRNTVNRLYGLLRARICELAIDEAQGISLGQFEIDESYFGARRVRGKRGRGAAGKTPVFGLLKRDGRVYVAIVPNCSKQSLLPIIQGHIPTGSTIYSDGWKAYDGLLLNGYDHYRIHHHENEFARGKNHVNGIESFWSFAKHRLQHFNGLRGDDFPIHLKECEFRFNHRNDDILSLLLKSLTTKPL